MTIAAGASHSHATENRRFKVLSAAAFAIFQRRHLAALALFCLLSAPLPASAGLPVRAAILVNLDSGKTLYEQNADAQIPPASLTKIMTLYLAFDQIENKKLPLAKRVRISREAASTGGSSMRLRAGERVALKTLLAGTAVASGNDAAVAVAQCAAGSTRRFVRMMNRKAKALGLRGTVFRNPTGLPAAGQKTTARDMMKLGRAYIRAHPEAAELHNIRMLRHNGFNLRNTNGLLDTVPGANGLKTGWTVASGYNIIITAKRNKVRLLAVVLGAADKNRRDAAARRLIEAGFAHPSSARAVRRGLGR